MLNTSYYCNKLMLRQLRDKSIVSWINPFYYKVTISLIQNTNWDEFPTLSIGIACR